MHLKIVSYRAVDFPELCMAYQAGHVGVLSKLGIKAIASSKEEWMSNPDIYFSLVYLGEKVVGGVRLQVKNDESLLPIESAIDFLDPNISNEVRVRQLNLTGEACGLWIGDEIRNMKMSLVLTRNTLVIARYLGLQSMFALTSQYTLNMTRILGFTPIVTMGDHGKFIYPTEEFTSTVCANDDLKAMSTMEERQRDVVHFLNSMPVAELLEATEKGAIQIEYNFLHILP